MATFLHWTLVLLHFSGTDTPSVARRPRETAPRTISLDAIALVAAMLAGATAPTRLIITATGGDGLVAAAQMMEPTVPHVNPVATLMMRTNHRSRTTFFGDEQLASAFVGGWRGYMHHWFVFGMIQSTSHYTIGKALTRINSFHSIINSYTVVLEW